MARLERPPSAWRGLSSLAAAVVVVGLATPGCSARRDEGECVTPSRSTMPWAYDWGATWGASLADGAASVALTEEGACVAGFFVGVVDFDPGEGRLERSTLTPGEPALGSAQSYVSCFDWSGRLRWNVALGGRDVDYGTRIVVGDDGSVFLSGLFEVAHDFDPGPGEEIHDPGDRRGAFVTKLARDGSHSWTRVWAEGGAAPLLALRSDGDLLVSGALGLEADPVGAPPMRMAVLDAADGAVLQSLEPDPILAHAIDLAVTASDGTALAVERPGGGSTVHLLDESGATLWERSMGFVDLRRLAVSPDGQVVAVGVFSSIGAPAVIAPGEGSISAESAGSWDGFAVALSEEGEVLWGSTWGGIGWDQVFALDIGADGTILVAGSFHRSLHLGGAPSGLEAHAMDAYLVALGAGGVFVGARTWGSAGDDQALGVAVDVDGSLVVVGSFQDELNPTLDGDEDGWTSRGHDDSFLVALAPGVETPRATCGGPDPPDTTRTDPRLSGTGLPQHFDECVARGGSVVVLADGEASCTFFVDEAEDPDLFAACLAVGGGEMIAEPDYRSCKINYFEDSPPCFGNLCD